MHHRTINIKFALRCAVRSVPCLWALSVLGCTHLHRSSTKSAPFCWPAQPGDLPNPTSWHLAVTASPGVPSFDVAAQALSGRWDVLTVTTEGENPPGAQRWQLQLVAADSGAQFDCIIMPCRRTDVRVVAVGAPLGQAPFDSVGITRNRRASDRVVARFDHTTNHVTLDFGPPMLDAGVFYAVTQVSDTTLAGRWTDGSYVGFFTQRGNVTTVEHQQGFFCARRVRVLGR